VLFFGDFFFKQQKTVMQKTYVVKHMFLEIIIYFISLEEEKKNKCWTYIKISYRYSLVINPGIYSHIQWGWKNLKFWFSYRTSILNCKRLKIFCWTIELPLKSPSVSALSPLLSPPIPSFSGIHKVRKFD
jgi:hypothetical protein